jgi:hypothetical protein
MKTHLLASLILCAVVTACARKPVAGPQPTGFGSAIVESSGGKQIAPVGTTRDQPIVVQVNDAQGNAVAGALVQWHGPANVGVEPAAGLTDASGQFTSTITLGGMAGHYRFVAATRDRAGKEAQVTVDETALGISSSSVSRSASTTASAATIPSPRPSVSRTWTTSTPSRTPLATARP